MHDLSSYLPSGFFPIRLLDLEQTVCDGGYLHIYCPDVDESIVEDKMGVGWMMLESEDLKLIVLFEAQGQEEDALRSKGV